MSITVRELIAMLQAAKNQDAVVAMSAQDSESCNLVRVEDETQAPDGDGVIGNFCLWGEDGWPSG